MLLMLQVDNLSYEADLEIYRTLLDGYFKSEEYQCPTEILDIRECTGRESKPSDIKQLVLGGELAQMRAPGYPNNVVVLLHRDVKDLIRNLVMQECDRYMELERGNGELVGRFLKYRGSYSDKIKLSVVFKDALHP